MIKLAVAVATADAMPDAFVVWRGIESSIRKAAEFGYDGIELALKTADQVDPDRIEGLLAEHGVECPCVSTGQVFAGLGLYFTTTDPAKRADVVHVFRDTIDLAAALGAMVNIGRARGFVEDGETRAAAEERFIDVARELAAYAEPKGVTLVLEPVNRYEINFVNSVAEGAELLEKVGAPNLKLMPDLFHMNIEDPSLGGVLEEHAQHVAYVHFADSNRLAPGQGHTDFRAVLESLKRIGYDGWGSVEILPKPDPDTAARQAIEYLKPLVAEVYA
ncbi:MAG: sugar phosphate isomerase/epimerase family protein [Planctomycetota bacterium]